MITITRQQARDMAEAHAQGLHKDLKREGCPDCEGRSLKDYPNQTTDFSWLIERGSNHTLYYAPAEHEQWTKDHLKACRFARKEDAEAATRNPFFLEYDVRITEHGWD